MTPQNEALFLFLNHYLAIVTFIGFVCVIIWTAKLILFKVLALEKNSWSFNLISIYVLPVGFFASLFSMLMSLFYSDYLGILPCGLCWFARIFIYSQVFLFGLAWYKNDKNILDYILLLSGVGLIISLYHEYLQLGYSEFIPCPTIASTIDCAKPTFISFGFVTFPFMAVVFFLITILLSITYKMSSK